MDGLDLLDLGKPVERLLGEPELTFGHSAVWRDHGQVDWCSGTLIWCLNALRVHVRLDQTWMSTVDQDVFARVLVEHALLDTGQCHDSYLGHVVVEIWKA